MNTDFVYMVISGQRCEYYQVNSTHTQYTQCLLVLNKYFYIHVNIYIIF